jgi:sugar transferase (PEP-CTERM/EpsH1 system associated)
MNVLVVIGQLPYPLDTGAKIRSYHLLTRLARKHAVTLVSFSYGPEDARKAESLKPFFREIVTIPHNGSTSSPGRMFFALRNLLSSLPYSIDKYTSPGLGTTVRRLLQEQPFDLIHCDSLQMSSNVTPINGIPRILTEHNVESFIWQRAAETERNPLRRSYLALQARRLARYEAAACRAFDWCIAVSEVDRRLIEDLSGTSQCAVVPNGVDCQFFRPQTVRPEPSRLVFTGSMDWLPNEDAMVYFVEEIMPIIRRVVPQARLSIVGRNPTSRVRQLARQGNGVEVTGRVDDVRPYIAQAAIFVTPLRIGSGTRLKILEAMAMGRPVVSTRVGCEGLAVTPGKDILVADRPQDVAARVIELLKDPDRAETLGQAGRTLVERSYDWESLADRLEEIWYRAAGR